MSVTICSLLWDAKRHGARTQKISYDSDGYHLVRFPYGASDESYDPWRMHDPANGGGNPSAFPDARSGLIWPSHDGWGVLSAMVFWSADSRPNEYRARFVRDPLNSAGGYDSTATTDTWKTGGGQYKTYMWQIFVHPGTPIGLKISARGSGDTKVPVPITHAQFKLAIHTDVKRP
ncbi:hypothetical protein [Streptomyces purpurogeneiscleroticus]|uniref:hypothetical protein n=1 Tax=Streptomyces purpurogeneiscleroticus TaxID=68259 RepID=UPI001CBE482F|nr:hypothetical protein [Streptomyces purpurogeneiscleroticus]MBZ4020401.1 hypothetical protein [Streptomyces purpurogeneiscleroticus]